MRIFASASACAADRDQAARDLEDIYATFPILKERRHIRPGCSRADSSRCW